jgi:hypothetical protein
MLGSRVTKAEEGNLALVPHAVRVGDMIALFKGGRCPFVVRKWGRKWKLVGDAYVHGMMDGEAWDVEECEEMDFV